MPALRSDPLMVRESVCASCRKVAVLGPALEVDQAWGGKPPPSARAWRCPDRCDAGLASIPFVSIERLRERLDALRLYDDTGDLTDEGYKAALVDVERIVDELERAHG